MALLEYIEQIGGTVRRSAVFKPLASYFPALTPADLAETRPGGANKWRHEVSWSRMELVHSGDIDSPAYGVWGITDKGRAKIHALRQGPLDATPGKPAGAPEAAHGGTAPAAKVLIDPDAEEAPNLEDLAEDYFRAFRQKVLQQLQDLTPSQFERFAAALLAAYGFVDVRVTGRAGDGGIDGHGQLKVGLARMNVAFQCKRWQGQVGRPEVDKFRGAIQGEYEQGIFFTTSEFSAPARDASLKRGAAPIVLIDGDAIVQLMVERGLGVLRRPVEIYEDQIQALFEQDDG